jgi:hypothetical protein
MLKRSQLRAETPARYWHIALCAAVGLGIFGIADLLYLERFGELPGLKDIWGLTVLVPLLCGAAVTSGARGAPLPKRIIGGAVCGGLVGALYTGVSAVLGYGGSIGLGEMATDCVWRVFLLTILSTIGVMLTELNLPEPSVK